MKFPRAGIAIVSTSHRHSHSTGRLRGPVRQLGNVAALLLALGLSLGIAFGLRDAASEPPSPPSAQAAALAQDGPLVVFSEFSLEADTVWAAQPDDPAQRVELATLKHVTHFGVFPSLSPDGSRVAYTVLPPNTPRPSIASPAELWLVDLRDGQARRLASGLDLRTTPVWSPSGDAVVARRAQWEEGGLGSARLVRIDLSGGETALAQGDTGLFPVGFAPDGAWFYYAAPSPAGTEIARVPAVGGRAETVAHVPDFTRDWQLAPDGKRLAFLASSPAGGFVAQVLDLATGEVETPLAGAPALQLNPVWESSGRLTVATLDASGAGGALTRWSAQDGSEATGGSTGEGWDAPLSWSPDGAYLALRHFQGPSLAEPGPSRVEVLRADGRRTVLSPSADVIVLGWLLSGGEGAP